MQPVEPQGVADRAGARDAVLLALAALAVHGRSIAFGFTGLDDQDLVVDDQAFLSAPSSLWRVFGRAYMHVVDAGHAYWRPAVTWTLALDAQWSGERPFGYHLTNVLLHVVACVLLRALLASFDLGRGASLVAALVFAVHPALAPAVGWIPGRNDVLLAVFALASWLALSRGKTAVHLALFALALLTKETAVALPVVWALHAALVPAMRRRRVLAVAGAGWGVLVAARVLVHPADLHPTLTNLPLLLGALGQVVLPVHPSVIAAAEDVPSWPGGLALVALGAIVWRVPQVRKNIVGVGVGAFVLLLLPSLLLPGTLVVGSRVYLPAAGLALVTAELVRALAPERRTLVAFAGVTLAALGALALAFEGSLRDRRAFARDAVAASPHAALAHLCLGRSDQLDGRDDEALSQYEQALALSPSAEVVHNDVAVLHMKHARWSEAERALDAEVAANPRYPRAYFNLGIVRRRQDRMADACAAEETAVRLGADDEATLRERDRDCATASPSGGSR